MPVTYDSYCMTALIRHLLFCILISLLSFLLHLVLMIACAFSLKSSYSFLFVETYDIRFVIDYSNLLQMILLVIKPSHIIQNKGSSLQSKLHEVCRPSITHCTCLRQSGNKLYLLTKLLRSSRKQSLFVPLE